ncbi:MAG: cyclic-di-AMP receptor [Chloroflexi bacterium]|nr:cyclic-di-AMP receptor [Chloroflexota bacterium]
MTLWIAVLHHDDAAALVPALHEAGLEVYVITPGGRLRAGEVTLLVAATPEQEATAQALLTDYAQTRSETRTAGLSETAARHLGDLAPTPLLVTVSGAVVFRLRVARYERW